MEPPKLVFLQVIDAKNDGLNVIYRHLVSRLKPWQLIEAKVMAQV